VNLPGFEIRLRFFGERSRPFEVSRSNKCNRQSLPDRGAQHPSEKPHKSIILIPAFANMLDCRFSRSDIIILDLTSAKRQYLEHCEQFLGFFKTLNILYNHLCFTILSDDHRLFLFSYLINNIGIPGDEFTFFDGSGGSDTVATNKAVIQMLEYISKQSFFPDYLQLLPILAVDGSLAFVTDFESDPTLAGAKGNVYAKTGTKIEGTPDGLLLDGQALGGYIDTKSGKRLMFHLAVNNVPLGFDITNVQQVFQDQGTITAIIWRDN